MLSSPRRQRRLPRPSRQHSSFAFRVPQEGLGLRESSLRTAASRDLDLFRVPLAGLLGGVRITSGVAARFHSGYIDVFGRREHSGILGDLVIVQGKPPAGFPPRVEGKHGYGAMVAVPVDGPLGEHHVGIFAGEKAREALIVWGIDDRAAVVLAGKNGARFQTSTSSLGFGGANGAAAVEARAAAESLAAVEIEQDHLMSQIGVAGDGPAAAALRVARMAARDDDFERR